MTESKKWKGAALLAVAGLGLGLATTGCDQPAPNCTAGRGTWTMVYTLVSGPAECGDTTVDTYGIGVYNQANADGYPDLKHSYVAIQADLLTYYADNAASWGLEETGQRYAFGGFAQEEPEGDFCTIPTMTPAKLDVPEVPAVEDDPATEEDESYPGDPAISFEYAWSNVSFYVSAASAGTVMKGDVRVTIDSMTCDYSAVGVYYSVYCGSTILEDYTDPDSGDTVGCGEDPTVCDKIGGVCGRNLVCQVAVYCGNEDGTPNDAVCEPFGAICNGDLACEKADQKLCDPEPDPDNGYPYGSGIDPTVPMKCDQATMMCVPNGTPPQLR